MRQTIFLLAILCCASPLAAQEAGRVFRTEVTPYDTRHDALSHNRVGTPFYQDFKPAPFLTQGEVTSVGEVVNIPYAWTDGNTYLHLENVGTAYTLLINDKEVARVEDPATPADFFISPYIKNGKNALMLDLRKSTVPQLSQGISLSRTPAFTNSYLYCQNKRSIGDFTIELVPDSTRKFGILKIDFLAQNSFNFEETVTVGYDIYSPQGKLLDFNIVDVVIPGRSVDTVHLHPYIYHTYENKWEAGKAPLYKVMLFTRRDGAYKEYIPLQVGFGKTELIDGKLMRLGKQLTLSEVVYNAAADRKTTLTELKALKLKGKNTLRPDYPQPYWFYDLCDELGLYVIDRANINAPEQRDNRAVGGTPSNDPALRAEYLERVKGMYFRSRNYTCVIGFALGGNSGNGYNMYKAYQWLKSVEKSRPVFYVDADGEWNSDTLTGKE
ncbi:MAG: glycoside hydrolase family 2 TIM barrel-domain containing protein [Alistipes sp.]